MRNKNGIEIDDLKGGDEVVFVNKSNSWMGHPQLRGKIEYVLDKNPLNDWEEWRGRFLDSVNDWYWENSDNQFKFYAPQGYPVLNSKRPFVISVQNPGKVKRKLYVPHVDWITKKLNVAVKTSDIENSDKMVVEDLLSNTFDVEHVEKTKSFKDLKARYEKIMSQAQYTEHDIMILMVKLGIFLSQHE